MSAIALACSMAVLTAIRFWYFSAPYPPGLDGAQWLSYGRALLGGTGRSAESTYAPLMPMLAQSLNLALGPALGLRVLATMTLLLLAAAIWVLSARVVGVVWGSMATALVLPSTAMAEPFFYGGYPQQASLAFGILGITALFSADLADTPGDQTRALVLASGGFLLSSACHLLFGPLLLVSGALVALGISTGKHDRRRFLLQAAATLAPATAVSLYVTFGFFRNGYSAPLAASQRSLLEAWAYATRESPGPWAAIVVGGIAAVSVGVLRSTTVMHTQHATFKLPDAVIAGFALTAPSGILLLASGQPRLVPPLLLGGALLFAFTCRWAARAWRRALPVVLATWSVAILWLAWTTTGLTREFAMYYQVLDASWLAAVRSIPPADAGAIAVAADRRGWPVGWWIEALQERPVLTGSNPQWLAFPEERTRADAVAALFASSDAQVLRERTDALDVAYLVMRKWDWIGWDNWIDESGNTVAILYDDNETIVLEITPVGP
ncbi:MAG: hypothetical protein M3Z20_09980 [Chloroflexota bacterium]|nr:hypothetical protein [Chloroflexota bacterium]